MDRSEIMTILPHRDDMLLLDEVTRQDDTAVGIYHVRGDEFFLRGHFPGNPVVPGVILCEILAQSACILLGSEITDGKTPMYTGLDRVRFKSPVRPGDVMETRCRITRSKGPFHFGEGTLSVSGRICMTAEFSFAIIGEK